MSGRSTLVLPERVGEASRFEPRFHDRRLLASVIYRNERKPDMSKDDLEGQLRGLLDRQAIHDCIVRYCRAVDRGDRELFVTSS